MTSLTNLRSVLLLLRNLLIRWPWKTLRRFLDLWRMLTRRLGRHRRGGGRDSPGGSALRSPLRPDHTAGREPFQSSDNPVQCVTICESRRPLSALELQLDHPHDGQFLQPGDVRTRPASMVAQLAVPGQSSGHPHELLQPFSYSHSNTSKASDISISVQSTSTAGWSHRNQADAPSHRPEARPTVRAAARDISRVASMPRSHPPSRATSRSRSRAPSPSPLRSHIDLPNTTVAAPTASQNTLAIPDSSTVPPTPERLPLSIPPSLMEEKLWPMRSIPRYDGNPTISPGRAPWKLPPVTLSFPLEGVPPGWIAYTHPEGQLYFYHPQKRIYTDNDVRDRTLRAILGVFEQRLADIIREDQLVLPADYDLVLYLEYRVISGGYNWCYYYADNISRTLFWVQEWDIINDIPEEDGIKTLSDLKYEIESKYWTHCELYPHNRTITDDDFTEVSGFLTFASVDTITSLTTTITYTADDVHRMLGFVKSAKAVAGTVYATVAVARMWSLLLRQRFLNFHGQAHARLSRLQSVYDSETRHSRTPLIKILSPIFWNAPAVHLRGLEKLWIDSVIAILPWTSFIGKLQNEWQEFVLYATVLLNANVAFLAIPSVDNGTQQLSAAQISSNISIVTSVGSILLGLLLIRQHRVKSKETAIDAYWFLRGHKHPTLGMETLAIIYSLPYALLMWGMVTFLLAFSFECFGTPDMAGVSIFAAVWIAIAILVSWCIITGWESGETTIKERLQEWCARLLPTKDKDGEDGEGAGSVGVLSVNEKAKRLAKLLKLSIFPHSSDPPTAQMEERASSV